MWFRLAAVDLDYLRTAPRQVSQQVVVAGAPDAVFAVLTGNRWPEWFPELEEMRWEPDPPRAVGGKRYVHVGPSRAHETLLAFEPARRLALRLDRSNLFVVKAMLVEFALSPVADQRTRVSLAWHYELRFWLRPFHLRARARFQGLVDAALAGLKQYVERLTGVSSVAT